MGLVGRNVAKKMCSLKGSTVSFQYKETEKELIIHLEYFLEKTTKLNLITPTKWMGACRFCKGI